MAYQTFDTVAKGAYLYTYEQALKQYQKTVLGTGLSACRRKALDSQILLLVVLLGYDDEVMAKITRSEKVNR
jgi:hypothetical protein